MVLENKDITIYLGQQKLAEWTDIIVSSGVRTSKIYQNKAERLLYYLQAIQYEFYLEDSEIIAILQCIEKIAEITEWPTAPTIVEKVPPDILIGIPGPIGNDGTDGTDGTNANVDVQPDDQIIEVREVIAGDLKTFYISYNPYTVPGLSLSITSSGFPNPNSLIQELGAVLSTVPVVTTVTKGKDDIVTSEILSPLSLDGAYQTILDLVSINGGTPQIITVNDSSVAATQAYTAEADDLTTQSTDTKTIQFVIPYLQGSSPTLLTQSTAYNNLVRIIETQGTKVVLYNGVDEYFYYIYDATKPDLSRILDGNGFDAIAAFTKTTENIDMLSGTESMKVYRTAITDIPNQLYTFIH